MHQQQKMSLQMLTWMVILTISIRWKIKIQFILTRSSLESTPRQLHDYTSFPSSVSYSDINGDGKNDVILLDYYQINVYYSHEIIFMW